MNKSKLSDLDNANAAALDALADSKKLVFYDDFENDIPQMTSSDAELFSRYLFNTDSLTNRGGVVMLDAHPVGHGWVANYDLAKMLSELNELADKIK